MPAKQTRESIEAELNAGERIRAGQIMTGRRNIMARILLIIPFVLMASVASAQGWSNSGCVREVSRFCRAHMDEGDAVILDCLKQHRARLSKICTKFLTDHGQ